MIHPIKFIGSSILFFFIALLVMKSASGGQSFYLSSIATPYKLAKDVYPQLEYPSSGVQNISVITIDEKKVSFNGNLCNYEIDSLDKFTIDRTMADLIDDAGGEKLFSAFLKSKLKTDMADWRREVFLVRSTKFYDSSACKLLQKSSMFLSDKEVILWDTKFFYRFLLGKDFNYGN